MAMRLIAFLAAVVVVDVSALRAADEAAPAGKSGTLDIYFIDVGRSVGNATLLVSPSGESMMLDAGPEFATHKVLNALKQAGVKQIDYLVNTHFHSDHFGGTAKVAGEIPVLHFVDHGDSVEQGKTDEWWKQRRAPWFRVGMGAQYDKMYNTYTDIAAGEKRMSVKPGDVVPIKGIDVKVVSAGGKVLAEPLPGAGQPNPACEGVDHRGDDDAEDGQSVGCLVTLGKFRFVFLGDLTWNLENALFCPTNKVGTCDAYLVTHHAQSMPKDLGDYYFGLCSCPKSEVNGLHPRVAILSLGALGHENGTSEAMDNVHASPGLEDIWQTEFIESGGEKDHNTGKEMIATVGQLKPSEPAHFIKLAAKEDGSFSVTSSRDGFSKQYPPRNP